MVDDGVWFKVGVNLFWMMGTSSLFRLGEGGMDRLTGRNLLPLFCLGILRYLEGLFWFHAAIISV